MALLAAGPMVLALAAVAGERSGAPSSTPVSIETILANPDMYQGERVVIRATVMEAKRAVAPNGRRYFTLSVGTEQVTLTVFSWTPPSVDQGDRVEVVGVYYPLRYNIHHVIVSQRVSRLSASTG